MMPSPLETWPGSTSNPDPRWQALYEAILQGNQRLNLTRITAPADFWEKHLWDSAQGIRPYLYETAPWRVVDIGTGAGFPGLVVALLQPHWRVTLLDARHKKTHFLQQLVADFRLENVTVLTGRAEVLGATPAHQRAYDLVLLRAVAPADQALAYGAPFVKRGGHLVLYQGRWTDAQTAALTAHAQGLQLVQIDAQRTPLTHAARHYIHLVRNLAGPGDS
ncbi:MAG: 16S rRNA (guanine(527)-N(7))-methyltransferase RsmG [Gloeomargarita sp. SKYBB_i_bin120]|nr:16S rRNA (guanine(527)-N(7))-methyltransferase RsmG [Gloeomargarita sp. SKYG98]MCS7292652.1 16S rRNA (guanine(527)-N(7))-methyltransferase RsmG [Gloeomargarita sp. SKYB120]MDW8178214.1 16S rRNA (guanine(527)-N(7))-methyltransferase RsmG [Gloeomargarita sp. SKYBB_i_bin120]